MSYPGVPYTFYNGVVYTGRDFADAIKSGRQHLPRDVKDALAVAESHGADYPLYSNILGELRQSLHTTDSYNRVMLLPWDVYNLTRKLIGIIETAHRNNVPIPRPETHEEYQASSEAEEKGRRADELACASFESVGVRRAARRCHSWPAHLRSSFLWGMPCTIPPEAGHGLAMMPMAALASRCTLTIRCCPTSSPRD